MSTPPQPGPYSPPPGTTPYVQQPPPYGVQPIYQHPYPPPPAPAKRSNPVGVAALICGILACVGAPFTPLAWLWVLTLPAAVILGIIGLTRRDRRRTTAIWGLSLGAGSVFVVFLSGFIRTMVYVGTSMGL